MPLTTVSPGVMDTQATVTWRNRIKYLKWLEEGNTPLPAEDQNGQNPV